MKYGTYRYTYWGEGRLHIQDQVNEILVAAICASVSSLLRDSFGRDHTVSMLQDSQDGCFQQPIQVKKLAGIVGSVFCATFTLDIGFLNLATQSSKLMSKLNSHLESVFYVSLVTMLSLCSG